MATEPTGTGERPHPGTGDATPTLPTLPVLPEQPRDHDVRRGELGREVFSAADWYSEPGAPVGPVGPVSVLTVEARDLREGDVLLGTGTLVGSARDGEELTLYVRDGARLEAVTYEANARVVIARENTA